MANGHGHSIDDYFLFPTPDYSSTFRILDQLDYLEKQVYCKEKVNRSTVKSSYLLVEDERYLFDIQKNTRRTEF
jgi:hypothetical protein